jgi:hypothetical protein
LGTGTDAKGGWLLSLYALCTLAVVVSVWWRLGKGWTAANATYRGTAVAASIVLPVAVAVWAVTGPLRGGWAQRAGTPRALIASTGFAPRVGGSSSSARPSAPLPLPLTSRFQGTQSQTGPDARGDVSVTFSCWLTSISGGRLVIALTGAPIGNGGVELTGSEVTLGTDRAPVEYKGSLVRLDGNAMRASLDDADGHRITADIVISLGDPAQPVSGTIATSR